MAARHSGVETYRISCYSTIVYTSNPGLGTGTLLAPAPTAYPLISHLLATARRRSPVALPAEQIFSVDLEEYFHANALERAAPRERWSSLPSRVEATTEPLLELFAKHQSRATFFVLGWVADRLPALVRRIAAAGHEIASHGYWHRRITMLEPEEFRADVRAARRTIEDCLGSPVLGYRAPSFSLVPGREWAFDVLLEEGYRYDSSIFPIRRPGYGYPGAPLRPYRVERAAGVLHEFPILTTVIAGMRLPAGGGGYLRQLPFWYSRRALEKQASAGSSGVLYVHPWDLDPGQPRFPVPLLTAVRHYRGLARTLPRLQRLFQEFRFTSIAARYASELAGSATPLEQVS